MRKAAISYLPFLLFFAALSLFSHSAPVLAQGNHPSDSKLSQVSKSQSQWWASLDILIEPQDFEEVEENVSVPKAISVSEANFVLDAFHIVPTCDHTFLSNYSGRLHYLNIPPPNLS